MKISLQSSRFELKLYLQLETCILCSLEQSVYLQGGHTNTTCVIFVHTTNHAHYATLYAQLNPDYALISDPMTTTS